LLHTLLALEAGGDTLTWVVNAYGIFGIHCLQALQEASFHPEANQHLPWHFTQHNIECIFEVHKIIIEWGFFYIVLFYKSSQYEKLVNSAIIFAKPSLTLGTQPMLFSSLIQPFVKDHNEQLC
jgi:hypothetical protein